MGKEQNVTEPGTVLMVLFSQFYSLSFKHLTNQLQDTTCSGASALCSGDITELHLAPGNFWLKIWPPHLSPSLLSSCHYHLHHHPYHHLCRELFSELTLFLCHWSLSSHIFLTPLPYLKFFQDIFKHQKLYFLFICSV